MVAAGVDLRGGSRRQFDAAIRAFEPAFLNDLVLVLEGRFVHRSGSIEKKGDNPLNEVRVPSTSLMSDGGWMAADESIGLDPATSILQRRVGDEIAIRDGGSGRCATGFFTELGRRFPQVAAHGRPGTAPYCPNLDRRRLRSTRCGVPCAAGRLTHRSRGH